MARRPAQVFHISEYIDDEMRERGWTLDHLAVAMGGDFGINRLALDFLFAVQDKGLVIGEDGAAQLALAFGTSAQLWRNLERAWLDTPPESRAPPTYGGGE